MGGLLCAIPLSGNDKTVSLLVDTTGGSHIWDVRTSSPVPMLGFSMQHATPNTSLPQQQKRTTGQLQLLPINQCIGVTCEHRVLSNCLWHHHQLLLDLFLLLDHEEVW